MTFEERMAEALSDLRHLRQNPTPEAARDILSDWAARDLMYDHTDSAWRIAPCSGTP